MGKRHEPAELTPQQIQALELLLAGQTITQTANTVGVDRVTVSRWKNTDPEFAAAYNDGLLSSWDATHKRLIDARGLAITRLEQLLEADDAIALKAAAALVRMDIPRPKVSASSRRVSMDQMFDAL